MTNRGSLSAPSKYAKCRCCICATRGDWERTLVKIKEIAERKGQEAAMKRGYSHWPKWKPKETKSHTWAGTRFTQAGSPNYGWWW